MFFLFRGLPIEQLGKDIGSTRATISNFENEYNTSLDFWCFYGIRIM